MITASKEIIWHLTCSDCHHYWTAPTMDERNSPARRQWHCPLCGTKSECVEAETVPTDDN
ncbi:MAG: hypothetical protein ACPGAM_06765 [Candidatus Puniceispirillaceae bacterium]